MQRNHFYKILYWLSFTLLIALLFNHTFGEYWQSWVTSILLLPSVVVLKYGIEKSRLQTNKLRRGVLFFFWGILCLYLSYIAIIAGYWYFLELNADTFDMVIVNPVFIWISLGFFIFLEQMIFKKGVETEPLTISIFSDRKKTILQVEQLVYVESRGDFTIAHLENGKTFKNNVKISQWEKRLPDFLRIHRAFLVNPSKATLHGNSVRIGSNEELPVSRSYKRKVGEHFTP